MQQPTEQEAYEIGVEAYVYFYPLVMMDVTRRQLTNIEAGKMPLRGPMNTFSHFRAFPTADFKAVVRPNFDTLYSSGWLDLTKENVHRARSRETLRWCRPDGRDSYHQASRRFSHQPLTSASSVEPRPMAPRTTPQ
jgi:hypothetical protein